MTWKCPYCETLNHESEMICDVCDHGHHPFFNGLGRTMSAAVFSSLLHERELSAELMVRLAEAVKADAEKMNLAQSELIEVRETLRREYIRSAVDIVERGKTKRAQEKLAGDLVVAQEALRREYIRIASLEEKLRAECISHTATKGKLSKTEMAFQAAEAEVANARASQVAPGDHSSLRSTPTIVEAIPMKTETSPASTGHKRATDRRLGWRYMSVAMGVGIVLLLLVGELFAFMRTTITRTLSDALIPTPTTRVTASPLPTVIDSGAAELYLPVSPNATSVVRIGLVAISAGNEHTCALTSQSEVKCWGRNVDGQLGDGRDSASVTPVRVINLSGVKAIAVGAAHTCALTNEGDVSCWGWNSHGQLGDASRISSTMPLRVYGLSGVKAIAAGAHHTCALTNEGDVSCWGLNSYGQLGNALRKNSAAPVQVSQMSQKSRVTKIALGAYHTCALTDEGEVMCWGLNFHRQLGQTSYGVSSTPVTISGLQGVTAVAAGVNHTCILTNDGEVKCWGNNADGQLGDDSVGDRSTPMQVRGLQGVTAVAAGANHTCVLTNDGEVKCWGNNADGQLGDGTNVDRAKAMPVSGLQEVMVLSAGSHYTCALKNDDEIKCWGRNADGQLGDGTTMDRTTPVTVSGL